MMHRIVHGHHQVTRVKIEVVGPTIIEKKLAEAKRVLTQHCIPAWEPFGFFPDGTRCAYLGEGDEGSVGDR